IASDHEKEHVNKSKYFIECMLAARRVRQMYGEFFKPRVVGLLLNNEMK
nr:hypothetical protein [Tanacetum cinerariifolium]